MGTELRAALLAAALSLGAWLGAGCGKGACDTYCDALAACGEDVSGCVEACSETVDSGGKDGQTDCADIWKTAGQCIDDSTCSEYDSACAEQLSRTDLCE